jgi:ribonuclease Z
MDLYFLGTAGGRPTLHRNCTSIILNLKDEMDACFVFDAGSGTRHQLIRSPIDLSLMEKLFITHLHGDHVHGVPELLDHWNLSGGKRPLTIYGPVGIRKYVETVLELTNRGFIQRHSIDFVEIREDGIIFQDDRWVISTALLTHGIECWGYRLEYKKGTTEQKIVTIMGDTGPCANQLVLSQDADLLVHESTFLDADGAGKHHSTALNAAKMAKEANVAHLIITHIAPRHHGQELKLLEEARTVFPGVVMADDLWGYTIKAR